MSDATSTQSMPLRLALIAGLLLAARAALAACALPPGAWVQLPEAGAPAAEDRLAAVWTGQELLVLGATSGARFDPCANRWRAASIAGMPSTIPMYGDSPSPWTAAVAGDSVVFLYPPDVGVRSPLAARLSAAVYDLAHDRWTGLPLAGAAPSARTGASITSTGREVLVFGGVYEEPVAGGGTRGRALDDGARLDPASGTWRRLATAGAPSARTGAGAAWTGSSWVVWGGVGTGASAYGCGPYSSCQPAPGGALYEPANDRWTPMANDGAPAASASPVLLWTGKLVVVWTATGMGIGKQGERPPLQSAGALFDPAANAWRGELPVPPLDRDEYEYMRPRFEAGQVVLTGRNGAAAVYDLKSGRWTAVPRPAFPAPSGVGAAVVGATPETFRLKLGENDPGGSPPDDRRLRGGWIARVDVPGARWELAQLPAEGSPRSLVGGVVAWTGDRFVFFGGCHRELDPHGSNGCEGARRPCDPIVATRRVCEPRGAMLRPVFQPLR